jgi:hypothetical protein
MDGLGMLLAGLGGAGSAAADMADKHMTEQADMLKEQRIQERKNQDRLNANTDEIAKEDRLEQRTIRTERRGLLTEQERKQQDLAFKTDPDNVQAAADSEVQAKMIEDRYKDNRFPTTLDQETRKAKALAEASGKFDPEKMQLEHDKIKAQIEKDQASAKGTANEAETKQKKAQYEVLSKEYERIGAQLSEAKTDDERLKIKAQLLELDTQIKSIYTSVEATPVQLPDDAADMANKTPEAKAETPKKTAETVQKPVHQWTKEEIAAMPEGEARNRAIAEMTSQYNANKQAEANQETVATVKKGVGMLGTAANNVVEGVSAFNANLKGGAPQVASEEVQRLFAQLPPEEQQRIMRISDPKTQQQAILDAIGKLKKGI